MFEIVLKLDATDKLLETVKVLASAANTAKSIAVEPAKTQVASVKETKPKTETAAKKAETKKAAAKKAETKKTESKTEKETKEKATGAPTPEELRRVTVLAVKKDRQAVVKMLENDFAGCSKISDIPESDRPRAIELLNQILEA